MRVKPIPHADIPVDSLVRVKQMGNITEIMHSERRSLGGYITKINKDLYVDNRTGEVKEISHNATRADDTESVVKSLARLRDYLNANVVVPSHCRWLTLTYAENMTDAHKLRWDFKNFNARCRAKYGDYEYITAAEPQGRGAWHLHVVLVFPNKAPFMENGEVARIWGKGFVSVRRLDNIDNVGAYLTAYLGDMDLEEYKKAHPDAMHFGEIKEVQVEADGKTATKRFVKGARLAMYPPGFHLYRCSKGIRRPEKYLMVYGEAKKILGELSPTYRRSVELFDTDNDFRNVITREVYNSARESKEEKK